MWSQIIAPLSQLSHLHNCNASTTVLPSQLTFIIDLHNCFRDHSPNILILITITKPLCDGSRNPFLLARIWQNWVWKLMKNTLRYITLWRGVCHFIILIIEDLNFKTQEILENSTHVRELNQVCSNIYSNNHHENSKMDSWNNESFHLNTNNNIFWYVSWMGVENTSCKPIINKYRLFNIRFQWRSRSSSLWLSKRLS